VIVAGNSVSPVNPEVFKERHLTPEQQLQINAPTRQLDEFLCQILGSCPVDLIPGPLDPTNCSLPQQVPLILFPLFTPLDSLSPPFLFFIFFIL
jgi:DNA polymerase II small subunit/DNA polymerase delta subunit B